MNKKKVLCQIYRSRKAAEEMYLYVDKTKGTKDVPEPLLEKFSLGKPVMTLMLHPEKKLARADILKVLAEIDSRGFYLQMPPSPYEVQQNGD